MEERPTPVPARSGAARSAGAAGTGEPALTRAQRTPGAREESAAAAVQQAAVSPSAAQQAPAQPAPVPAPVPAPTPGTPPAEATLGGFEDLSFCEEGQGPNGEHGVIRARPEIGGDVVLARKDVGVAYHLAVAFDDAMQGVTHVVRGQDLFEATHLQRLIQALMGWPAPIYRHHRLLTGPDGRRFAKRDRAETLRELRARGVTPDELRREMGFD